MMRYIIELAIIHLVLIGAYWVFLKNERHYSRLRYYLLGSTVLALLIPALRLPAIQLFFTPDSPVTIFVTQLEPMQYVPIQEASGETGYGALYWVYTLLSGWFLLKVVMGLIYLIKLRISSERDQLSGIPLRKVLNLTGSFSFFNWIFVSKRIEKEADELLPIVKHEHAHVCLGHSYDLIFFQVFRVVFWWLPSAWYINQEIKKIHEFQADAYALKSYSIDQYSSILISSTLKSNGLSLASSFHDGLILKRLNAMKQQMKKISTWKLSVLGILTALMVITFACNEELDAEIKKMGESSNAITFDQLPPSMQTDLVNLQDQLTFMRVVVGEDDELKNAAELQALDPSTIHSITVQKPEREIYIALKKEGASFDYLAETSKSDNEVFTIVEDQPQYPGGMKEFYRYVGENMTYPTAARESGIEGRVYVQFVINPDGTVSDVMAVKGIGEECDNEAVRVVKESANWTPGQQRGKKVAVRMVMPVVFKLDKGSGIKEIPTITEEEIVEVSATPDLKKTPINEILEPMIVVGYAKTDNEKFNVQVVRENGAWKGVITNQQGNPMPGASIIVSGTNKGTVSDRDGSFILQTEENAELVVSYVGYETVKIKKTQE